MLCDANPAGEKREIKKKGKMKKTRIDRWYNCKLGKTAKEANGI